jgi:hypothetical protein
MIDITNYETWFLLYADNELSAEGKATVLSFVQQHPTLQQEFNGILQLRFSPAEIQYQVDKASLLSISMEDNMQAALEEYQLLINYIDGELSFIEIAEVEKRLKHDVAFLASYKQLSILKLEPDHSIVHPNKNALYKREKTVAFGWKRSLAAAASLIIAAGLFWIVEQPNVGNTNAVVLVAPESKAPKTIERNSGEKINPVANNSLIEVAKKKSITKISVKKIKEPELKSENYLVQEVHEPSIQSNNNEDKVVDAVRTGNNIVSNNLPIPNASASSESLNNITSNQEFDVSENYDNSKKEGRKPFKTLSRKISRILGKDRDESDQIKFIQVANFQVAVSKQ